MISCSAVTQNRTWLFILGSLEAQKGKVPFYASFALCCFLKHKTFNGQFVKSLCHQCTPILAVCFANSCGKGAVGFANTEAVTQHKPLMAHSERAAPGCCDSESSSPLHKGQRVKWKSKQEFSYSHSNATLEAVEPS